MMNENTGLEDRLESLGEALRARSQLTDRVMDEVRKSVADRTIEQTSTLAPRVTMRRRPLLTVVVGSVAAISIVLLAVVSLFPSPSVGYVTPHPERAFDFDYQPA